MEELLDYFRTTPELFGADALTTAPQFAAPEQVSEIVECLSARGYAVPDIQRIVGGNLLRIACAVWK